MILKNIVNQKNIIKFFDASQACYIGILVGIKLLKNNSEISSYKPPKKHLRLVHSRRL